MKFITTPNRGFLTRQKKLSYQSKKLKYNGKLRSMMIAYEKSADSVEIITIPPISDEKIINRVMSGRWIKNG